MTNTAAGATPHTTRNIQSLEQAHVNWVLREADRREYGRFDWLSEPPAPTEPRLSELTFDGAVYSCLDLARENGARLRFDRKPHAPLHRELADMQADSGPLVLVTMLHPELDEYSTVTPQGRKAIVKGSKAAWRKWLKVHARTCTRLTCHPQRDEYARTHSHAVLPLVALSKPYQRIVTAAKPGSGGGDMLPGNIHAVRLGITADDHEGVARYLSRYPNDAATLPRYTPEWLELAEEVAENMQYGDGERINLCWRLPPRWTA